MHICVVNQGISSYIDYSYLRDSSILHEVEMIHTNIIWMVLEQLTQNWLVDK